MTEHPTIAVIGAGAVGCFYGARLAKAGYPVKFLMRSDYEAVKERGLHIKSIWGDFDLAADVYENPKEIGPVNLVVCALKTTALNAAQPLFSTVIGPETKILALMNGLGVEEKLAHWFPETQVLGGLAFTCINRTAPGYIDHQDYGHLLISHLQTGAAHDEAGQVAAAWAADIFRRSGVQTDTCPSLKQARWQRLCWNIPYNTLSITAGRVTTDQIMADPGLRRLVELLMDEVLAGAAADGAALRRIFRSR